MGFSLLTAVDTRGKGKAYGYVDGKGNDSMRDEGNELSGYTLVSMIRYDVEIYELRYFT